jgi:hypothetical protein
LEEVELKKYLSIFILLFFIQTAFSQNQVISRLKQPPPNRFGISDLWSIDLNNTTRKEIKGYIVGTLSEDKDGLIVEARTKLFTIKPGNNTYTQKDFPNADVNYYNNRYKEILLRTGGAPDGDYTICITVYNESDEIIGQENCIYHSVRQLSNITLISPDDESVISENEVVFSWVPLPSAKEYSLRIVELLGNQSPLVAMRDNRPFLQKDGIKIPNFQYPANERKFSENKTYAWQVYLKDNPEQTASEIWTFTISKSNLKFAGGDTTGDSTTNNLKQNVVSPCNSNLPSLQITNNNPDNKSAQDYVNNYIKVGHFKMKVLQASGNSAGLTGKGSIVVPWLKTPIAVEFQNIKINSDTVMFNGTVFTEKDQTPEQWPYQWGINVVGNFNWTEEQVKKLDNWLHNAFSGWPVVNKLVKDFDLNQMVQDYTDTPLKLPLGFNNIKGYTIAISEMKFEPTTAKLNCLAIFPVEDDTLAFKGGDIPFSPQGPSSSSGELALIQDVSIVGNVPNGDTYEIVIKKKPSGGKQVAGQPKGTFINWDCQGFNTLNVDLDFLFPRTWLKPIPDNGQKAKASAITTIEHWDDLIVQTSLSKCSIVGTSGVELEVSDLWFDNSLTLNPTSISFPTNYTGTQGTDFRGFFLKLAKVSLPNKILSTSNQPVEITLSNMIINKQGLTGSISANNLLTFPNGRISSMSASVDSVKLILLCSSVTDAYVRGKIVLPVSETNQQNALLYKINLMNSNSLQVSLQPQNPITAKLFGNASLTLSNTSTFDMWLSSNPKFLLKLNGNFNIANLDLFNIKRINIQTDFQNLKLDYDESRSQQQGKLQIDAGQWSFASPQKSFAGIPITIKNIKFNQLQPQSNELLVGSLSFKVEVNLNEKFSGSSALSIVGSVTKNNNGTFQPHLNSVLIDTINLNVNLAAVKAKGQIAFFSEISNPTFGNGFGGNIKATFNSIQMEVSSSFRVGSTKYNNGNNYYRYWYVEAKAVLPKQAGIVFLPGVAFYGFGAAAWQRINVSNLSMPTPSEVQNAGNVSNTPTSGATFTPDNSIGFGFKVMAVMGTYPEPKTFNLDAALSAQFSTSGGLNKISFITNFWAQAELIKRNEAPVYGDVTIEYTPPDKLFLMTASAFIKYPRNNPVVRTDGIGNPNDKVNLALMINGKTNKWYFTAGTPYQTNKVKIFGITSWEYLMFGNDIGQFVRTGFQPQTLQGLATVGLYPSQPTTQIPSLAGTGRGFAFGTGVFFSVDKSLGMGWLSWAVGGRTPYLKYGGGGGYEINLSLLQYNGCNGNPIGFNNWYANGSAAAWLYGYARVELERKNKKPCLVCCKGKNDPDPCVANLASIKVGFWTQAGFINPSWVQGQATVYVNVFGLNWSGNVNLNWGSPCSNIQQTSYTQTFTQEYATDKIGDLILNVDPQSNDLINPGKKIYVYTAYDETPFEVPELQSNGTIQTKTFKVTYTANLIKYVTIGSGNQLIDNQVPQNLTRSAQRNYMNAYEYWINRGSNQYQGNIFRNLDDNSKYKFTVRADLWKFNTSTNSWEKVKDKNNNFIYETKSVTFDTDVLLYTQNNSNPLNNPNN